MCNRIRPGPECRQSIIREIGVETVISSTGRGMAETFRNFIGGSWVGASSGRTFETRNPADTGEVVGDLSEVRRPTRGRPSTRRRRRSRRGPPSRRPSAARSCTAPPTSSSRGPTGRPRDDARGGQDAARGARRGRPRDQHPALLSAAKARGSAASTRPSERDRVLIQTLPPAARRRRADHAVELPDRDPDVEDRPRADRRQRRRPEAVRPGAALRRCGWSRRSTKPASPRARSTSSPGRARRSATRSSRTPT